MAMTQEEYLRDPNRCPVCRKSNIEGEHFEVSDTTAFQRVICNSCGARWVDEYQLTGYTLDD